MPGTGSWSIQYPVTFTTSTFNADSAHITFSSTVVVSTGAVFNANTSLLILQGNFTEDAASETFGFCRGISTITGRTAMHNALRLALLNAGNSVNGAVGGQPIMGSSITYNYRTGTISLTGSAARHSRRAVRAPPVSKTLTFPEVSTLSANAFTVGFYGNLNVSGSMTANAQFCSRAGIHSNAHRNY